MSPATQKRLLELWRKRHVSARIHAEAVPPAHTSSNERVRSLAYGMVGMRDAMRRYMPRDQHREKALAEAWEAERTLREIAQAVKS